MLATDFATANSKIQVVLPDHCDDHSPAIQKVQKISTDQAIQLNFMRSLGGAKRFEAKKNNLLLDEGPIAFKLRTVKMLRDLLLRAHYVALRAAAMRTHARARARRHAHHGKLEMHSGDRGSKSQRTARKIFTVQSIVFCFLRSMGIVIAF